MFRLIKQVFITLLSFSEPLSTKCMSLNNQSWMTRSTFIDLNLIELNYYPFMVSLDKCNRSYNTVDDLYMKLCFISKAKDIDFEVFNTLTRIIEVKTLIKHILFDCESKFDSTTCNSNQKCNNNKCESECKKHMSQGLCQ